MHIFKDDFTKFQDESLYFSNSRSFPRQGQIQGLFHGANPVRACHINPQIQFVDICWGHGMRSVFSSTVTMISGVSS